MIFKYVHTYIFQLLVVSGGATLYNGNGGIRISSTEIYSFSDNAWRVAGALPRTMWGMSAATINNRFLLFGNIQTIYFL